jgi:energy-coupling factor transporter ATP-binding protein EcfA2
MSEHSWYRAFGLLIRSDLTIPEYRPAKPGDADIVIRSDNFARKLRDRLETGVADIRGAHLTDQGVLLHVERVGDFFIHDGREIYLTPMPEVEIELLRLYLIGSVMGTLFHQRGTFILHGAAVLTPRGVSAFVGPSGAGKSTLAAHLAAAEHPVLADDTLPLFEQSGHVLAWPGAQVFKMWDDALQGLGRGTDDLAQVSRRYGKFFLANPMVAKDAPEKVKEVFVLEHGLEFSIQPISSIDAISALNDNTYRREFIGLLGREQDYLKQLGRLTGALKFYRFTRPDDAARIPESVGILQSHWDRL